MKVKVSLLKNNILTKVYLVLLMGLPLVGCETIPSLSSQQKRALQTKIFTGHSYNTVFKSIKSVMQDEGYLIKNQDMVGGLIVAELNSSRLPSKTNLLLLGVATAVFSNNLYNNNNSLSGKTYIWSINLEEINKKLTEVRMILHEKEHYSSGGQAGREVVKFELYRNIFNKIVVEINRRELMRKSRK